MIDFIIYFLPALLCCNEPDPHRRDWLAKTLESFLPHALNSRVIVSAQDGCYFGRNDPALFDKVKRTVLSFFLAATVSDKWRSMLCFQGGCFKWIKRTNLWNVLNKTSGSQEKQNRNRRTKWLIMKQNVERKAEGAGLRVAIHCKKEQWETATMNTKEEQM